jgi:hypothetical protein
MIRREKESFDDQIEVKLEVEKRRIIFFMKISSNTLAQFALHVNDFKNICVKCFFAIVINAETLTYQRTR